ncbi:MAG: 5'/3'-nucleotidase SurE [Bryobacteraceae bacterium]
MKIVITNDDGMDAPGLAALGGACASLGEVFAVAPDCERSGVGHQITTAASIAVIEDSPNRFRICGTPADCTRLALSCLVPDAGLVVAGINRGGNLGVDIYISGTVAAAREAALHGVPAVAISQYILRGRELDWARTEAMASRVLHKLLEQSLPGGVYFNVNLPHLTREAPEPEIVECPVDFSPLQVRYRRDGDQYRYSGDYYSRPRRDGTDVDLCFAGNITVTAIPLAIGNGFHLR